jgi:hypothetical protein
LGGPGGFAGGGRIAAEAGWGATGLAIAALGGGAGLTAAVLGGGDAAVGGLTWLVIGLAGVAPFGLRLTLATGGFFSSAAGPVAAGPALTSRAGTVPLPVNSPGLEVAAIAGRP